MATASSKIKIADSAKREDKNTAEELNALILIKDKIMCPAIILAASRTARVRGRITSLIVSINTINGIKAVGHPNGTRWANMLLYFNHPITISLNHIGKAKENVILIWLVRVNVKGKIPEILKIKITIKMGNRKKNKWILIIFISCINKEIKLLTRFVNCLDGILVLITIKIKQITQLDIIFLEGSKIEKRDPIIRFVGRRSFDWKV